MMLSDIACIYTQGPSNKAAWYNAEEKGKKRKKIHSVLSRQRPTVKYFTNKHTQNKYSPIAFTQTDQQLQNAPKNTHSEQV